MNKQLTTAMNLLPAAARKHLNLVNLREITGAILIADRIEQHFDAVYRSEAALRKFKIAEGYCAGRVYCMAYVGNKSDDKNKLKMCPACRKELQRIARGETRGIKRSEYGRMQLKKRRETASERARQG